MAAVPAAAVVADAGCGCGSGLLTVLHCTVPCNARSDHHRQGYSTHAHSFHFTPDTHALPVNVARWAWEIAPMPSRNTLQTQPNLP